MSMHRTEYSISTRLRHSGSACSNCDTPYKKCSEDLFKGKRGSKACCHECEEADTHDTQRVSGTRTPQGVSPADLSAAMHDVLKAIPDEILQAEVNRRLAWKELGF